MFLTYKRLTLALSVGVVFTVSAQENLLQTVALAHTDTGPEKTEMTKEVNTDFMMRYESPAVETPEDASLSAPAGLLEGVWNQGTVSTASQVLKSARRGTPGSVKTGYMITKDHGISGSDDYFCITLQNGDNGYVASGIYGVGGDVTLEVNQASGQVSITPQLLFTSNYGDVWICSLDYANRVYSTQTPITGTLDADGNIALGGWGAFIVEGQYAGNAFGAYMGSDWLPSNATMVLTDLNDQIETLGTLLEQTSDNTVKIYNFAGNGTPVTARLTASGAVKISPQYIAANAMYGDLYCYSIDAATGKIATAASITGAVDLPQINIGSWCVAPRSYTAMQMLSVASLDITLNPDASLTLPTPTQVSFSGQGTSTSPYIIATAADLNMLSQGVADGNSYTGRTFSLTADIDMTAASAGYTPIGEEGNEFDGTFLGNGHTVSNLALNGLGNNNVGLFGVTGAHASISNLNMTGCSAVGSGTNVALLAGYNKGSITNCAVQGAVITQGIVSAGIAACNDGNLTDCSFEGTVKNLGTAGAIAGDNYGRIVRCSANADIALTGLLNTTYSDAGGICGATGPKGNNGGGVVSDCVVRGSVTDSYGRGALGGITGTAVLAKVERCLNTANIQGARTNPEYDTATGGIVGISSESVFRDCVNSGNITKTDVSENVGGLAGYLLLVYSSEGRENVSHFYNCYSSAPVTSTSAEGHKGIYGSTFVLRDDIDAIEGVFTNCYFDNQLTGLKDTEWGRPTSYFDGGTLPEGFSSDVWSAQTGSYPMLTSFAGTTAAKLATSHPVLASGETARKVKTPFALSNNGVTYKLYTPSGFSDVSAGLTIDGGSVSVNGVYSNDLLVAIDADARNYRIWPLAIAPALFNGEGTAESPYLIQNTADFKTLDMAVSTYGQSHEGDYFRMTNDVDFALADEFAGVGAAHAAGFAGVFDGDNHHIKALKIHSAARDTDNHVVAAGSYYYGGLFNVLLETGVIKNLIIDADCDIELFGKGAAVAGYSFGRIENCRNYADVDGAYESVAGIAGATSANAVVTGCYNAGNITIGGDAAGGIVAENFGNIELCQNDGAIAARQVMDYSTSTIKSKAGGIAAWNYGNLDRCVNNARITASKEVGGLVAINSSARGKGDITNSVSNGFVDCTAEADTKGGVIGNPYGNGNMANTYYDCTLNTFGSAANGGVPGVTGLTAATLANGALPEGLEAEDWSVEAGKYPSLARFATETATQALRSMVVAFDGNNNRNNVVSATSLYAPQGATWTLSSSQTETEDTAPAFVIEDNQLKVTLPEGMSIEEDVLTCTLSDRYEKVIPVKALPILFAGSGTDEDPYLIANTEDWNKLASFISTTKTDFSGTQFRLTADLDFSADDVTFSPIASGTQVFQGVFDGNGHSVNPAYNVVTTATGVGKNVGMVGTLGASGKIHDMTMNGTFTCNSYGGAFVGKLYGRVENCVNSGTVLGANAGYMGGIAYKAFAGSVIDNCVNTGSVAAKATYVGGIVAETETGVTISNCRNEGLVSGGNAQLTTATKLQNYVAGIAALCNGTVENCVNLGTVEGNQYVAGIVAQTKNAIHIVNSHNRADITALASDCAGILATATAKFAGELTDCTNTGAITGTQKAAGIAVALQSGFTMSGCSNSGAIKGTTGGTVAGVVASVSSTSGFATTITDCHNTAEISSAGTATGGFLASTSGDYTIITDCYNTGNVTSQRTSSLTSTSGVGGFGGNLTAEVTHCWNSGNVTSNGFGISGFAGYGSGTLRECFNLGNVTSTYEGTPGANFSCASGFFTQGKNTVINCYNMGDITAPMRAAGLCGGMWAGALLQDSYNAGKVTVTGDDDDVDAISIYRNNSAGTASTTGCVYDADVNGHLEASAHGVGLSTMEMFCAEVGDGFITAPACYPRLEAFAEHHHANFMAAHIALDQEDSAASVQHDIVLADLPGVEWTASDHFVIDGATAIPVAMGEGTLTATTADGQHSKTFNLTVTGVVSGLDETTATVSHSIWYDLEGRIVTKPAHGIYVVKERMSDGTVRSRRVVVQ